ncbi:MAG: hypothetical protein AAF658_06255, partial [Myxococcota bacterium]
MLLRSFTVAAFALSFAAGCGEEEDIARGSAADFEPIEIEVVSSSTDPIAEFSNCRVAFDRDGEAHLAYRFFGTAGSGVSEESLRFVEGGSGSWRDEVVGVFERAPRGFDLALELRKPRIFYGAEDAESRIELVQAEQDNSGRWNNEMLEDDAGDLSGLRLLNDSNVDVLRAVLPPRGAGVFRDGRIAFGDWRFEAVGAVGAVEAVVALDATMDRSGAVHVCAVTSSQAGDSVLYATDLTGTWDLRLVRAGALDAQCSIGADAAGVPSIAFVDQSQTGETLTVSTLGGGLWAEEVVIGAAQIGAMDLVSARDGSVAVGWIDVSSAELVVAFQADTYAPLRALPTHPASSATL